MRLLVRLVRLAVLPLLAAAAAAACTPPPPRVEAKAPNVDAMPTLDAGSKEAPVTTSTARAATFDEDLAFLRAHGRVIVLAHPDGGNVAVSPLYQGRVMTSAVAPAERSLGWINRPFIAAGKTGTPFDNFGGEDRFWLGPEGGQYGLYFPPGRPFTFDAWQTPHAMQEGAWDVAEDAPGQVVFTKRMTVTNWSKTSFDVDVERTVRLLSRDDAAKVLGLGPTPKQGLGFVGFETQNRIVNGSGAAWKRDTGLLSIWILAMFSPAADARVLVPFEKNAPKGTELVNDRYFGKVPAERLSVHEDEGYLSFTCDGKERGKIGLGPARAKNVLGSYSAQAKLLTIVHYDGPKKNAPYLNSMWEQQRDPYGGDVVNSYNDGPPAPGKPPLGGFYEIETSSPGVEVGKNGSAVHTHRTFHFVGEPDVLAPIAKKVLGVALLESR